MSSRSRLSRDTSVCPLRGLALGLALAALGDHACAQGLAGDVSAISAGGPLTSIGNLLGGAQIQAAKGAANASFKISRVQSLSEQDKSAQFNTWSATISGPINKKGDDTALFNHDSLAADASLELAFSRFAAAGKRPGSHVASKRDVVRAICKRALEARLKKDGIPVPEGDPQCDPGLIETYGSAEDKHEWESSFWDLGKSSRWLWGGSAKVGYEELAYVTAAEATKYKQDETPWSVGLWGAIQPDDRPLLLSASLAHKVSFKQGDSATVCPAPPSPPAPVKCETAALGAPKRTTERLLTLEARMRPGAIGLALAVTREFEAKATNVELPVYFALDKDGKLTAGVKATWHSEKKGALVFFVGTPFGLYK